MWKEDNTLSHLVIVESPAKAKTIEKYLGKDYSVVASVGHIRDLPKSKLGVDVEHGFEPQYENKKDKSVLIRELKKDAKYDKKIVDKMNESSALDELLKGKLASYPLPDQNTSTMNPLAPPIE